MKYYIDRIDLLSTPFSVLGHTLIRLPFLGHAAGEDTTATYTMVPISAALLCQSKI